MEHADQFEASIIVTPDSSSMGLLGPYWRREESIISSHKVGCMSNCNAYHLGCNLAWENNSVVGDSPTKWFAPTSKDLVDEIKDFLKRTPTPGQLNSFLKSSFSWSSSQEVMDALFEALFDGTVEIEKGFSKLVTEMKSFLSAVTQEAGSQMHLLHAVESFCGVERPQAATEVALILKALYDDDLLEKEFILKWYQQGCRGESKSSAIWKNAKPFVEWLQNAESKSEEE